MAIKYEHIILYYVLLPRLARLHKYTFTHLQLIVRKIDTFVFRTTIIRYKLISPSSNLTLCNIIVPQFCFHFDFNIRSKFFYVFIILCSQLIFYKYYLFYKIIK